MVMMKKINFFLTKDDKRWHEFLPNVRGLIQKTLCAVCDRVWNDVWFLQEGKRFSINLCLSNDAKVHALNREFRGIDKPTNVLSFANYEAETFEDELETDAVELGDVIIALETLQREAQEQKISLEAHFMHLWTHGILHLLGYDHIEQADAEIMEAREVQILADLGVENPYQE